MNIRLGNYKGLTKREIKQQMKQESILFGKELKKIYKQQQKKSRILRGVGATKVNITNCGFNIKKKDLNKLTEQDLLKIDSGDINRLKIKSLKELCEEKGIEITYPTNNVNFILMYDVFDKQIKKLKATSYGSVSDSDLQKYGTINQNKRDEVAKNKNLWLDKLYISSLIDKSRAMTTTKTKYKTKKELLRVYANMKKRTQNTKTKIINIYKHCWESTWSENEYEIRKEEIDFTKIAFYLLNKEFKTGKGYGNYVLSTRQRDKAKPRNKYSWKQEREYELTERRLRLLEEHKDKMNSIVEDILFNDETKTKINSSIKSELIYKLTKALSKAKQLKVEE